MSELSEHLLPHERMSRRRFPGPYSACGDGDTALNYHGHDDWVQPLPAKTAIVADLDHLQQLVDQYLASQPEDSAAGLRKLFVTDFISWIRQREENTNAEKSTD